MANLEELYLYSAYLNKLMPVPTDRNWLTKHEAELRADIIRLRLLIWSKISSIEMLGQA